MLLQLEQPSASKATVFSLATILPGVPSIPANILKPVQQYIWLIVRKESYSVNYSSENSISGVILPRTDPDEILSLEPACSRGLVSFIVFPRSKDRRLLEVTT